MQELDINAPELARRVGVSAQSVRFWLEGRNFPGKRHASAVERALSFKLDYSVDIPVKNETMTARMGRTQSELYLEIQKLPAEVQLHLLRAIQALNTHLRGETEELEVDQDVRVPRRR